MCFNTVHNMHVLLGDIVEKKEYFIHFFIFILFA